MLVRLGSWSLSLLPSTARAGSWLVGIALCAAAGPLVAAAPAASPSAEQALRLRPTQKDVDYDRPTAADIAKCTIKAEKVGGKTGWVIRDGAGQMLRNFADTNSDNVVDQWSYFKDGVEVYRDIDSNFNGKADQCRWLNTAGTRWGLLAADDGKDFRIETWKMISPEEVTAEVVSAVHDGDQDRFERLLLTPKELQSLGLGTAKAAEISKKLDGARAAFRELLKQQKIVGSETRWAYFGATRPGIVPAGTEDSQNDLLVYENVSAMVETAGKHAQFPIGTLVRVHETWRLLDAPKPADSDDAPEGRGILIPGGIADRRPDPADPGRGNKVISDLLKRMEELDKATPGTPEELAKNNVERAEILEQLAKETESSGDAKGRLDWLRQLADTISAASQAGAFPNGVDRLKTLLEQVQKSPADPDLTAFVHFRWLRADYTDKLRQANADYAKIQEQWLKDIEGFLTAYPNSADAPEAMIELANGLELAGEDNKALKWYKEIISAAPKDSHMVQKARGAARRLESVGQRLQLSGKSISGKGMIDLANYKGRVVLVHYWAAEYPACTADFLLLQALVAKYGKQFTIVGVNLDNDPQVLSNFLKQNKIPGEQIYEPGGLDSRLANEMGIVTLPTMILLDKDGRVLKRSVYAQELESELKSLNLGKSEREAAGREAPDRRR